MQNCCVPTIKVLSVSSTSTVTTLYCNGFVGALRGCGKFNLCFDQCLPNTVAGNTVSISDGTNVYPVETRSGNNLRVTQLLGCCPKHFLHMRLLSDPVHVQCLDCLPEGCNPSFGDVDLLAVANQASAKASKGGSNV